MNNGWVKLHRGLLEWEWYDDINTCRLFVHLVLVANHKDKNWRGITIKKGQKLTSQIKLSEETGLTRQQVRSSLTKLKSTNNITIETSAQNTVVTIVNWDRYQQDNQPSNQPVTNEQPTDNQRITTNKNDKKERNTIDDSFLELVSSYWNESMYRWAPKIDLTKNTQINKKRISAIKRVISDYPEYASHKYWDGHIEKLSVIDQLQWQRENNKITFDQAIQPEKFERNLGYMKMVTR